METPTVERRRRPRLEPQQQPQQREVIPHPEGERNAPPPRESPRKLWQELAETQARQQSGKL